MITDLCSTISSCDPASDIFGLLEGDEDSYVLQRGAETRPPVKAYQTVSLESLLNKSSGFFVGSSATISNRLYARIIISSAALPLPLATLALERKRHYVQSRSSPPQFHPNRPTVHAARRLCAKITIGFVICLKRPLSPHPRHPATRTLLRLRAGKPRNEAPI